MALPAPTPHLHARAPCTSPRLPSPRGRPALGAHEAPLSELGASAASPWKSPVSATTVVNCLSWSSALSILCRFTGDPDMASSGRSGRPTMPRGPCPRARPIQARRGRAGLRACAGRGPAPETAPRPPEQYLICAAEVSREMRLWGGAPGEIRPPGAMCPQGGAPGATSPAGRSVPETVPRPLGGALRALVSPGGMRPPAAVTLK